MNDDTPASCDLYDYLSAIANHKKECCLTYLNEEGQFAEVQGQIIEIYDANGSDWCKVSDGSRIRLDRIEEIAQS